MIVIIVKRIIVVVVLVRKKETEPTDNLHLLLHRTALRRQSVDHVFQRLCAVVFAHLLLLLFFIVIVVVVIGGGGGPGEG